MHAYLIVGNSEECAQKAREIAKENNVKRIVDFVAKKVGDVREINRFTKLNQGGKIALFIDSIDKSTNEAANALLKTLEEKSDFVFLLTAKNKYNVLPTISSRCLYVHASESKINTDDIQDFLDKNLEEKILYATAIKDREEALNLLDKILHFCAANISNEKKADYMAKVAQQTLLTKKRLWANTNLYLQLANYVIQLDE